MVYNKYLRYGVSAVIDIHPLFTDKITLECDLTLRHTNSSPLWWTCNGTGENGYYIFSNSGLLKIWYFDGTTHEEFVTASGGLTSEFTYHYIIDIENGAITVTNETRGTIETFSTTLAAYSGGASDKMSLNTGTYAQMFGISVKVNDIDLFGYKVQGNGIFDVYNHRVEYPSGILNGKNLQYCFSRFSQTLRGMEYIPIPISVI